MASPCKPGPNFSLSFLLSFSLLLVSSKYVPLSALCVAGTNKQVPRRKMVMDWCHSTFRRGRRGRRRSFARLTFPKPLFRPLQMAPNQSQIQPSFLSPICHERGGSSIKHHRYYRQSTTCTLGSTCIIVLDTKSIPNLHDDDAGWWEQSWSPRPDQHHPIVTERRYIYSGGDFPRVSRVEARIGP